MIKARLFGAARASGEVMIFLDSHCEVRQLKSGHFINGVSKLMWSFIVSILMIWMDQKDLLDRS